MMELNQPINDFIVPATSNKNIQLSKLKGFKVILFFYPKDNAPGCTIECQDFSANYPHFRDNNCLIFGVSRDNLASHERFKEAQSLPFELISDESESLCKYFDLVYERELFGKPVQSLARSTFVISEDGLLEKQWTDVKVKEHVHEVIAYLDHVQGRKTRKRRAG